MQKPSIGILAVAAAAIILCAAGSHEGPPEWAYPLNTKKVDAPRSGAFDGEGSVPGSRVTFTDVHDVFDPVDWFPESHGSMPDAVAHGRQPNLWACSYCHMPNGQGRPENASLAGLPIAYIIEQVKEIREGRRRSAQPDTWRRRRKNARGRKSRPATGFKKRPLSTSRR